MSKLTITKDHKFSLDGINIISVSKGDVIDNPSPEFLEATKKCSKSQTKSTKGQATASADAGADSDNW